jgi:phosphatidylglycerol---prolipoprotein diacylglyceryl transferase
MNLFIHWSVNPEIFHFGNFAVRWYGVLFALGFLCGYFIMYRIFTKEKKPHGLLDVLLTYMFLGTVIGARLGHCLFYEPGYYLSHPLDILKVWEGGLASHGGAIGILIAIYIFSKRHKFTYLWTLDRIVITVAQGGFFIRMGNLMNSEIFGKATDVPWAFVFTHVDNVPRHPSQIYEALSYLLIFFFLLIYYFRKDGKPKEGMITGMFLILLFSVRFFIEFLKEVQVGFENNLPLDMGQFLSIPFIIAGIVIIFRKSKPGRQIPS